MFKNIKTKIQGKWFTKWWGILIIVVSLLVIALGVNFVQLVLHYKKAIGSGDIIINSVLGQYSNYGGASSDLEVVVRRDEIESIDSPNMGSDNPIMTIVIFSDFDCPYCAVFYPALKQFVIENNDKVKLIFRDFPLDNYNRSMAANCAFEQEKFWQMHDKLFYYQDKFSESLIDNIAKQIGLNMDEFNTCYNEEKYREEIEQDLILGIKAGVQGTPTIFINGEKFAGVMSKNILEQILGAIEAN